MKSFDIIVGVTCTLILLVVWSAYLMKKNNNNTIFGQHTRFLGFALTMLTLVQIGLWVYFFIKTKHNQIYKASYAITVGSVFTVLPLVVYFGYNLLVGLDSDQKTVNNPINSFSETSNLTGENGENGESANLTSDNGETSLPVDAPSLMEGALSSTSSSMPADMEATA